MTHIHRISSERRIRRMDADFSELDNRSRCQAVVMCLARCLVLWDGFQIYLFHLSCSHVHYDHFYHFHDGNELPMQAALQKEISCISNRIPRESDVRCRSTNSGILITFTDSLSSICNWWWLDNQVIKCLRLRHEKGLMVCGYILQESELKAVTGARGTAAVNSSASRWRKQTQFVCNCLR